MLNVFHPNWDGQNLASQNEVKIFSCLSTRVSRCGMLSFQTVFNAFFSKDGEDQQSLTVNGSSLKFIVNE